MNNTNKIYFDNHTAKYNSDKRNEDDTKYIRKDALLEKFNEFKSSSLPGKTIVVYLKEYLESL